jgi:hypothetical protein
MWTFQVKQFVVKSERFTTYRLVSGNAKLLTDPGVQLQPFQRPESWQGFDLLAICIKIREVSGASAAYLRGIIPFRAVAQLGRAPGSGPGGRGFKSHQPDRIVNTLEERVAVLVSSTEIK